MEKQDISVKKEAPTDERYGRNPNKRPVEELIHYGVVNLDKPPGPTSHQVSDYVQQIISIDKAGHSGTLDPRVTGVLPVALGRATRLAQLLLKGGKEYVGVLHLHGSVDEEKIKKTITQFFVGKIKQVPPIKSAVVRREREREVYAFDILEIDGNDVLFRVSCQAGVYIRKICHDLGQKLGVGGHMADLRRTRVSHFNEDDVVTLQDLKDAFVLWKEEGNEKFIRFCVKPAERIVEHLPKVWVFDSAVESICHGRDVGVPGVSMLTQMNKDDVVAIMTLKDELVALGVAQMDNTDILKKDKGLAVKAHKVFMLPGTYAVKG